MLPAFFAYMEFRTLVNVKPFAKKMTYDSKVVSLGSCFSTEMGNRLLDRKYDVLLNPLGIAFNPMSIAMQIEKSLDLDFFKEDDFFCRDGIWRSFLLHSDFSGDLQKTIQIANNAIHDANEYLRKTDFLLLTFGSAFVYRHKEKNFVVANCHKEDADVFKRELVTVDEITSVYNRLIDRIINVNPNVCIVMTVSPIRHLRDGLDENCLSKATLRLAVNSLVKRYAGNVVYFPSYEIMMDDLRDYRFYAEDMTHPSSVAVDYIFEKFSDAVMSADQIAVMRRVEKIVEGLNHRMSDPKSASSKQFAAKLIMNMNELTGKYHVDFKKEKMDLINRCGLEMV